MKAVPLALVLSSFVASGTGLACRTAVPLPPPPPPAQEITKEPPPLPEVSSSEGLEVRKVPEEIVVASWSEPSRLQPGGGEVQILVRVQKRGGRVYPGVEVRLKAAPGTLYSQGRILVTDRNGMTRDRLTTRKTSRVVLNAGGVVYRFTVPVMPEATE
jgi:hypothetical protein